MNICGMSADKRPKGRRRRPAATSLVADSSGQHSDARNSERNERRDPSARRLDAPIARAVAPDHAPAMSAHAPGDDNTRVGAFPRGSAARTPAQRAAELARAAHALAAQTARDALPTNVGDGVTFAPHEAPEIPIAPYASETIGDTAGAHDDAAMAVVDAVTEEASVTLEQEQRERAITGGSVDDERPTLLGLPLMAGALSGSSNPNPQNGPETTRRARPPRPTRPIPANEYANDHLEHDGAPIPNGAAPSNVAAQHTPTSQDASETPDTLDALDEPTTPRQTLSPNQTAPSGADAASAFDASNVGAARGEAYDAIPAAPDAAGSSAATAPEGLEPLAALTPLVSLGAMAPAAFADAALAEEANADASDVDASDVDTSGTEAEEPDTMAPDDMTAGDAPHDAPAVRDNGRLQAMDLSEGALGALRAESADQPPGGPAVAAGDAPQPAAQLAPSDTPGDAPPPGAPRQAPEWPRQPGQTPPAANAPQAPGNIPGNAPANPPTPPVMPGAPLAPLGAQFGAPPPGYQAPYPAQMGAAPQPGQPGQPPDAANAQVPTHAPWAVAASWGESSLSGPNTAAGMSYLFWWLSGIFVYFNERQNRFVRFHAMQSILLTGALTIISVLLFTVLELFDDAAAAAHQPALAHIGLGVVIIGYALGVLLPWFGAMVAAWSGTYLRIPFIGDYAERFAAPPREVYPDQPPY